jgi:TonB family protein
MRLRIVFCLFALLCTHCALDAQQPPAPVVRAAAPDKQLDAGEALIGRALILRCLCADNNLSFDAAGHLTTTPKTVDWTLAAVNITKAERRAPNAVELEGVRVALRFAADRREWERHPQADEKIRLTLTDSGDLRTFRNALDAIFAQGIDLPLQRSLPPEWRHYFDPAAPWTTDTGQPDALTGQPIYNAGSTGTAPVVAHRSQPNYTSEAQHDHVKGDVLLRLVVDANGNPQRVAIVTPLGYGLDEAAVRGAEKFRFTPGTHEGKPANVALQMSEQYVLVAVPPH